jgi:predicted DNA-binding protein
MSVQKTKTKTYRIKIATLDAIDEICKRTERKHNWYVQKILDNYLENLKKKQNDSR